MSTTNASLAINRSNKSRILLLMICGIFVTSTVTSVVAEEIVRGKNHDIEISGFSFIGKVIEVNVGDTITWTNKDIVPHSIVDSSHQVSASPDLATGETYTLVIDKPMSYLCGLHPSMKGKVILTRSP